jgi:hypothetical protein
MIILDNKAKPTLLRYKLPYLNSLTVHLYQNDYWPIDDDDVSSYHECNFGGYDSQPLDDFGPPYLNDSGQGQTDTGPHEWVQTLASPANWVYGYYVTDSNGWLIFADRNDAGKKHMDRTGAVYSLRIHFLEDTYRS